MQPAAVKPLITLSQLEAVDVRVGTIESVHDLPRSNKLVRFVVDFGDHRRTVLAGMKQERADLNGLVGRQALFVVNLEPRRMAGEVSEAMVFDLGYADGIPPALVNNLRSSLCLQISSIRTLRICAMAQAKKVACATRFAKSSFNENSGYTGSGIMDGPAGPAGCGSGG